VTSDLMRITLALGGEVLALGGLAADAADGEGRMQRAFESGQAAETFGEMVAELGGPSDFVDRWRDRLPAAKIMVDIHADETGSWTPSTPARWARRWCNWAAGG
jgi:thymidine phosphorylase